MGIYECMRFIIILLLMFREVDGSGDAGSRSMMKLHHVLQDFKHTEQDKSALSNKINVLKMHYDSNKRKAKNIQSTIIKINEVKQHFQRERQEIAQMITRQKQNHIRKIAREKEKRENSKENIQLIRNLMAHEKQQEYLRIKERERANGLAITHNLKKSLHEKRQRSLEVKLQEEESRLTKTIFLETKRLKAQRNTENEMAPLELGLSMNERYLTEMRKLESDILKKVDKSRESLSKSKLTYRRVVNQAQS